MSLGCVCPDPAARAISCHMSPAPPGPGGHGGPCVPGCPGGPTPTCPQGEVVGTGEGWGPGSGSC